MAFALIGEVGELSEIFQWRGSMDDGMMEEKHEIFLKDKGVHIGEEIADCLIYTVRLSDLCKINLSKATQSLLNMNINANRKDDKVYNYQDSEWNHMTFQEIIDIIDNTGNNSNNGNDENKKEKKEGESSSSSSSLPLPLQSVMTKSPRSCILELNKYLGQVSSSFLNKSELDCGYGLPSWSSHEIETLAMSFSSVIVCLICVAKLCNLSIDKCLYDKMNKNNKKYPVEKCKGKSSKYTAYMKKTVPTNNAIVVGALIAASFFVLGRSSLR